MKYRNISRFASGLCTRHELRTAAARFVEIVNRHAVNDQALAEKTAEIVKGIEAQEEMLKIDRKSPLTSALQVADHKRGQEFEAMNALVRAQVLLVSEPALSSAARMIKEIIDRQGPRIARRSYAHESTALTVLLEELATPAAQQALATLGLTGLVERLRQAQQEFEALYQQKVAQEAHGTIGLLRESQKQLGYRINALFVDIDSASGERRTQYAPMVAQLNLAITEIMATARSRRTRRVNGLTVMPQEPVSQSVVG